MRRFLSLLVLSICLGVGSALAQQPAPTVAAPAFWAVSVADLERSIEWYRLVFGLEVVREVTASDGSARAVVLRRAPLVVELIQRGTSRDPATLLPAGAHDFDAQGLVKVGLRVSDAAAWHARLTALGVEVDARVMMDGILGVLTFVARDPEGNRIQFFSRRSGN